MPLTQMVEAGRKWLEQLEVLAAHPIPRRYSCRTDVTQKTLNGFADASQEAYGAVVYIKSSHKDGTATVSIVTARARVVPLKGLTIPRAELTAAHLLAKLLKYCAQLLNITGMYAWSDSSIVLCWLRKSPRTLKTFVSNRVQTIQNLNPTA